MNEEDRILQMERQIQLMSQQLKELKEEIVSARKAEFTEENIEENFQEVKIHSGGIETSPPRLDTQGKAAAVQPGLGGYRLNIEKDKKIPGRDKEDFSWRSTSAWKLTSQNMEHTIGKNIMGILASLLIFIGIISLSVLVYPLLSTMVRFILMWMFALIITGAGRILYRKNRNAFSTSLFACGIGSIYLALLLTRIYFRYLNDYLLYVLLAAWFMGVVWLTREEKSRLFYVIAYMGLCVSVIFGAGRIDNGLDLIFVAVYQLVGIFFGLWVWRKRSNNAAAGLIGILLATMNVIQNIIYLSAVTISFADISGVYWSLWQAIVLGTSLTTVYVTHRQMERHKWKNLCLISIYLEIGLLFFLSMLTYSGSSEYGWILIWSSIMLCVTFISTMLGENYLAGEGQWYVERKGLLAIEALLLGWFAYALSETIVMSFGQAGRYNIVEYSILALAVIGVQIAVLWLFRRRNLKTTVMAVVSSILYVNMVVFVSGVLDSLLLWQNIYIPVFEVVALLLAIGLAFLLNRNERRVGSHIVGIVTICICYVICSDALLPSFLDYTIGILPVCVGFVLLGLCNEAEYLRQTYIKAGMIIFYIGLFFTSVGDNILLYASKMLICLVALCVAYVLTANVIVTRKTAWKSLAYIMTLWAVSGFIKELFISNNAAYWEVQSNQLIMATCGIILLAGWISGYTCQWSSWRDIFFKNEISDKIACKFIYVMTTIWILIVWSQLGNTRSLPLHWMLVVVGTGLTALKVYEDNKETKSRFRDYWSGIIVTLQLLFSVYSFVDYEQYQILGSILCLVLAVIFILVGFRFIRKGLRLYGLVLSVLSVLKLVLVDITYENSIVRVVGFVIGGMLCFSISFVYNTMAKKYKE